MQAADPIASDEPPRGALRVLARRNDTEILVLHGEHEPGPDERLAVVEFFPSLAVAEAVSRGCSRYLIAAHTLMQDGWHAFPVAHVHKLIRVAKNHINADLIPSEVPRERQAWTGERCARLGLLIGIGWTAKMIADDALIRSTENNVYRQAHKLGLHLRDAPRGQISVRLPIAELATYDHAAARARMTRDAFLRRFLISAAPKLEQLLTTLWPQTCLPNP